MFFWWICGGESCLPVLFLCHLRTTSHSSVLAWRIPGTGEPGGLPSMGSHRVRHDWSDLAAAATVSIKLITTTDGGKWGKKSKRIYRTSQKISIIYVFLESLLSGSFPSLGVTVHLTFLGCPPTLCWSLNPLWGSSNSNLVLLLCIPASNVHSYQN